MSATPGPIATHGAVTIRSRPPAIMLPSSAAAVAPRVQGTQSALEGMAFPTPTSRGRQCRSQSVRQDVAHENAQWRRPHARPLRPRLRARPDPSARTNRPRPSIPWPPERPPRSSSRPGRRTQAAQSEQQDERGIASIASDTAIEKRVKAPRHQPDTARSPRRSTGDDRACHADRQRQPSRQP